MEKIASVKIQKNDNDKTSFKTLKNIGGIS